MFQSMLNGAQRCFLEPIGADLDGGKCWRKFEFWEAISRSVGARTRCRDLGTWEILCKGV